VCKEGEMGWWRNGEEVIVHRKDAKERKENLTL